LDVPPVGCEHLRWRLYVDLPIGIDDRPRARQFIVKIVRGRVSSVIESKTVDGCREGGNLGLRAADGGFAVHVAHRHDGDSRQNRDDGNNHEQLDEAEGHPPLCTALPCELPDAFGGIPFCEFQVTPRCFLQLHVNTL
jgi:hypothetical protein